jgi:hypothetical protein
MYTIEIAAQIVQSYPFGLCLRTGISLVTIIGMKTGKEGPFCISLKIAVLHVFVSCTVEDGAPRFWVVFTMLSRFCKKTAYYRILEMARLVLSKAQSAP